MSPTQLPEGQLSPVWTGVLILLAVAIILAPIMIILIIILALSGPVPLA